MYEKAKPHFSSYSLSPAEYDFLAEDASRRSIKTVLEFGPGISTFAFLSAKVTEIISLEYNKDWVDTYTKTFKENKNVTVVHFENTPYLDIKIANKRKFDAAFIDSPTGGMYRKFSRINSMLYASARSDLLYMHDADRGAEQRTIAVLQELGWDEVAYGPKRKIVVLKKKNTIYKVLPRHMRK
jgi:predicted O-methyltransferase YrrM